MRGLIYKDITVFFKNIDKRLLLIVAAAVIVLLRNAGSYAGLFASVMLAMTVGLQNVMGFSSDEKATWKKYQLALPVKGFFVVACKYISVICTLAVSLLGSLLFNLLSSVIFHRFDFTVWGLSIAAALIIPLLWTGICLPFTYWFGFHAAQSMGLLVMIPMFYLIKYFEDGAGFSSLVSSASSLSMLTGILSILLFGISMLISVMGYERKK